MRKLRKRGIYSWCKTCAFDLEERACRSCLRLTFEKRLTAKPYGYERWRRKHA